jgi:phage gp29-like protein
MPWVVGRVPRMTNETDRAALLSKLVTMVQDAVAVINDDERVEFLEEKGKTGTSGIYSELIDTCNKEISKAILGQTATTEGTPGKLGEEKGQVETKEDLIEKDKRMVKSQLNLFFQWAVMLNLSNTEAPVFHWQEEEDIQADRAERDDKLKNQGVRFTKSYFTRVYGFEETDLEIAEISQGQEIPPGDGINMPGFAEKTARDRFSQGSADKVAREAAIASQEAVSKLLEPVLSRIEDAKSFDDVGEILYGMYPDLDSSKFQDLLARAMFASAGTGYAAASEEN